MQEKANDSPQSLDFTMKSHFETLSARAGPASYAWERPSCAKGCSSAVIEKALEQHCSFAAVLYGKKTILFVKHVREPLNWPYGSQEER